MARVKIKLKKSFRYETYSVSNIAFISLWFNVEVILQSTNATEVLTPSQSPKIFIGPRYSSFLISLHKRCMICWIIKQERNDIINLTFPSLQAREVLQKILRRATCICPSHSIMDLKKAGLLPVGLVLPPWRTLHSPPPLLWLTRSCTLYTFYLTFQYNVWSG